MKRRKLRAGDRVIVRSPEEILSTLDADGTLDGLPFMPEMLERCGKPFRVERRVEKTCVDVAPLSFPTDVLPQTTWSSWKGNGVMVTATTDASVAARSSGKRIGYDPLIH